MTYDFTYMLNGTVTDGSSGWMCEMLVAGPVVDVSRMALLGSGLHSLHWFYVVAVVL